MFCAETGIIMKVLLTAVNAKYIHSNPAVYSLYAYAGERLQQRLEIAEYTINQHTEEILADIYERQPDVIAVSCYLWNISMVESLTRELAKLLPGTDIWLGGPEVSYDALSVMERLLQITGIMIGEGESTFRDLCTLYETGAGIRDFSSIRGIAYRNSEGTPVLTPQRGLTDLNQIPFLYNDGNFPLFDHRIIYYESSRGCPFSCSYCLSSIDRSVRFRNIELVKQELAYLLARRVPQVKFVDRTFNCSHEHAMAIWEFIRDYDNGITNFHFEIAADLLKEEELVLLNGLRPGLVQLEIGVQSTNPATIREIRRTMDFAKLSLIVKRIQEGHNIHEHLDLIAGLPYEDYECFIRSFNDVMSLKPEQLQLGFLKVLKGSFMYENAEEYGLAYMGEPPYEVLFTKWITYAQIRKLKAVEEMTELYYNSCQFKNTMHILEKRFRDYYTMYESLAIFYRDKGYGVMNPSRIRRYEILLAFAEELRGEAEDEWLESVREALTVDLYLREKMKTRPSFCKSQSLWQEAFREFYRKEAQESCFLPDYQGYDARQLARMTHLEAAGDSILLFDYRNRDLLTNDARLVEISREVFALESGKTGECSKSVMREKQRRNGVFYGKT